jgi:hypothetical protein
LRKKSRDIADLEQAERFEKRLRTWQVLGPPLVLPIMLIGAPVTLGLTIAVAAGKASPFVWDISSISVWKVSVYLLSYAFIVGVASIGLYDHFGEYVGVRLNLLCSIWFLITVVLFERPIIQSFRSFFDWLPSGIGGKTLLLLWGLSAVLIVKILRIVKEHKRRDEAMSQERPIRATTGAASI